MIAFYDATVDIIYYVIDNVLILRCLLVVVVVGFSPRESFDKSVATSCDAWSSNSPAWYLGLLDLVRRT